MTTSTWKSFAFRLDWYLVLMLLMAPWFDNVHYLPQIKLQNSLLSNFSTSGIANTLIMGCCIAVLACKLIPSYLEAHPSSAEWTTLCWAVLNIVHFKKLDVPGVVSLENAVFLTALLLALFRHQTLFPDGSILRHWGFKIFVVSYGAGLVLPFLFHSSTRNIFMLQSSVERYCGWSGIGSIAFCGVTLATWGFMLFVQPVLSNKRQALLAFIILLGMMGVSLTAVRIAWLALLVMNAVVILQCLFRGYKQRVTILVGLLLLNIGGFYFSPLKAKAGWDQLNFKIIHTQFRDLKSEGYALSTHPSQPVAPTPVVVPVPSHPQMSSTVSSKKHKPKSETQPASTVSTNISAPSVSTISVVVSSENKPNSNFESNPSHAALAPSVPSSTPSHASAAPPVSPASKSPAVVSSSENKPSNVSAAGTPVLSASKTATVVLSSENKPKSIAKPASSVVVEPVPPAMPPEVVVVPVQNKPEPGHFAEHVRKFLWNFDAASNGRIGILYFLVPKMQGHWVLGLGTGAAGRILREEKFSTLEAHNEYLRFLLDHGLVGFSLLFAILVFLLKKYSHESQIIAFIGIAVCMLTDNYLIYPSFGYGPLFIAMFTIPSFME